MSLRESLWLAKQEIKRSWLSYPATGSIMAVFGLMVAGTVDNSLSDGGASWSEALPLDYLFLVWGSFLALNFVSREHFASWGDSFSKRLVFLRGLPISTRSIVAGRMLGVIPVPFFTVPGFFLPIYVFSEIGDRLEPWSYVWFAGMWVGYGLLWAGLWIFFEFGVRGKTWNLLILATIIPLMVVVGLLEWTVGLRLVEKTLELAREHGPLPAFLSLAAGTVLFVLLSRATVRRVEKRDLSA